MTWYVAAGQEDVASVAAVNHSSLDKKRLDGWVGEPVGKEPRSLSNTQATLRGSRNGNWDDLTVDTHGDLCHIGISSGACLALRTCSGFSFVTTFQTFQN